MGFVEDMNSLTFTPLSPLKLTPVSISDFFIPFQFNARADQQLRYNSKLNQEYQTQRSIQGLKLKPSHQQHTDVGCS